MHPEAFLFPVQCNDDEYRIAQGKRILERYRNRKKKQDSGAADKENMQPIIQQDKTSSAIKTEGNTSLQIADRIYPFAAVKAVHPNIMTGKSPRSQRSLFEACKFFPFCVHYT